MISQVNEVMRQRKISINVRPEVFAWIVQKTCHDRSYGARPLRRAIQRYIEDPLSEALIQSRFQPDAVLDIYLRADSLYYVPAGEAIEAGTKLSA